MVAVKMIWKYFFFYPDLVWATCLNQSQHGLLSVAWGGKKKKRAICFTCSLEGPTRCQDGGHNNNDFHITKLKAINI